MQAQHRSVGPVHTEARGSSMLGIASSAALEQRRESSTTPDPEWAGDRGDAGAPRALAMASCSPWVSESPSTAVRMLNCACCILRASEEVGIATKPGARWRAFRNLFANL